MSANEGCTRLWKSEIHFDGIFEGLGVQPLLAANFVCKIVNWAGFWPLLTVVVSFLAVVASLLAAWIGGRIAGKYALLAQKQAALEARQRDQEIEQQALAGTLRAIEADLKVHKDQSSQRCFGALVRSLE